jgi:hypothetical protein
VERRGGAPETSVLGEGEDVAELPEFKGHA